MFAEVFGPNARLKASASRNRRAPRPDSRTGGSTTFDATWSLAAGVSLLTLSRRMGTSFAMIDATYGHPAPDAEEQERALLDAFDAVDVAAAGEN